jgi:hypothetical protein
MSADEKSARSTCSATRSSDFDTETSAPCGNRRRRRPPKIRDGQAIYGEPPNTNRPEHRKSLTLLYLPPYAPNLNLVERLWKFIKRRALYGRYHPTFAQFQAAIQEVLDGLSTRHGSTPGSSRVTRAGWLGSSWRQPAAPSAPASDLRASPFGHRPQPPLSCVLRLNHAFNHSGRKAEVADDAQVPAIRRGSLMAA